MHNGGRVNNLNQTTNSYVTNLHQTLMTFYNEAVDNDFLLKNDDQGYEKLLRDAYLAGLIRQMKHLTIGQYWGLSAGDDYSKPVSSYCSDLMKSGITDDEMQKSLFYLADSFIKGLAVCKIEGEMKWLRIGDDKKADWWWVPTRLIPIDKRRLKRIRGKDEQGRTIWTWAIFDVEEYQWVPIEDLTPYIFHFYDSDESNPYGRGLGGSLYYYWHAKAVLYEMMLVGAETWAGGWIVAYIDGLKRYTDDAFSDRATRQQWIDQLEKMKSHKILVMADQDKVSLEQGPSQGHQIILDSMRYLDDAMAILLLSSNLININAGGSYALAKVKADEQQAGPIQYNRISLSGAMTKYLIWNNVWRKNLPNFRARGLGMMRPPKFSLDQKKLFDPEVELRIAQQMQNLGQPIKASELYERIGYTQPGDNDDGADIIRPAASPQPSMGGRPFGKKETAKFAKKYKDANEDFDSLTEHTSQPVRDVLEEFF